MLETTKGGPGILPAGGTATVAGFGAGTFDDTGFQVTFGGTLAGIDVPAMTLAFTGASGFVGETAHGGPQTNQGFLIVNTGNHAPIVTVPAGTTTIPPRTPFSADRLGHRPGRRRAHLHVGAERPRRLQHRRGQRPTTGTGLVQQPKLNGPLFRQFGVGVTSRPTDTLKYHSPGENAVSAKDNVRVFPDMGQIISGNTNAATGACPTAPATGDGAGPDARVLLGVPADDRLHRLPRRPHDDVPPDRP